MAVAMQSDTKDFQKVVAGREYALDEGLHPLHAFDLWGVIVDQKILGRRKIQLFRKLAAKEGMSPEEIARVVREYQDLLNGTPYAVGTRKSEIIDAMDAPTFAHGILPDYATAFFQDAVAVIKAILDAGEKVMVFTSKPAEGLVEQLSVAVGHRMDYIHYADKNRPDAFRELYYQQRQEGNCWISHTADELPELIAARKTGLFSPSGLIYVNRNNSNSKEDVREHGIGIYVNDLRDIGYPGKSTG
jgi:phosphoglycolate phosphatase-like HAD superfamily hydrolase